LVTTKLSTEGCIILIAGGRLFWVAWKHEGYPELHEDLTEGSMGALQLEKHIPPKWIYQKYKT